MIKIENAKDRKPVANSQWTLQCVLSMTENLWLIANVLSSTENLWLTANGHCSVSSACPWCGIDLARNGARFHFDNIKSLQAEVIFISMYIVITCFHSQLYCHFSIQITLLIACSSDLSLVISLTARHSCVQSPFNKPNIL